MINEFVYFAINNKLLIISLKPYIFWSSKLESFSFSKKCACLFTKKKSEPLNQNQKTASSRKKKVFVME